MFDVPVPIKAMAIVAACAGLTVFALHQLDRAYDRGYAKADGEWQTRYARQMAAFNEGRAKESEEARRKEREANEKVSELQEKYREATNDAAKSADRAARQLRDLRMLLAAKEAGAAAACTLPTAGTNPPGAAPGDGAGTAYGLLGECAGQLVEVAGSADRLKAQVTTLQDYARLVSGMQKK